MNLTTLRGAFAAVSGLMDKNRDYLIELDQQNGDGDLGISMAAGFKAVSEYLNGAEEKDLGKLFMKCGGVFNEAASSSLGTILSMGFMGMARALRGKTEADISELALAMEGGLNNIMEKAKSKPGEKTILDALCPAVEVLKNSAPGDHCRDAFKAAAQAAAEGAQKTKAMKSVHGRAAYYGDKSIGILDGGSVAGMLIFEGMSAYCETL
ncbi:MAG: dihydroxyacetone kinase subunit L [Treponema sp.]|jgi:dihydroxyacetone kinase-like protein|nr:dihydroxyacetone kinase subunit L [Treponema sp.]